MKKILLIVVGFLSVCFSLQTSAQSFGVEADTVWFNVNTTVSAYDTIVPIATGTLTLKWHVVASDFPSDWLGDAAFGLCDANLCRQNTSGQLWNGTSGTTFTCSYPGPGNSHNFDMQLDFSSVTSTGTHYVTVNVLDQSTLTSKSMTFIVSKVPAAVSNVNNTDNNILLYPNPATSELNVVYNANADIKNIAIYNIIGKVMAVYKVSGTGANMSLENMPSGIYFVRLTNSHGDVVATKKFTKQ